MVPVGLVVLKSGSGAAHDDIAREIIRRVRDELGPVAAFKSVHVVGMLPKTRSGKILRSTIRAIANGESPQVPATIDDASALEHIHKVFRRSEEHTSELQSLMRISYAVFCMKKKNKQ